MFYKRKKGIYRGKGGNVNRKRVYNVLCWCQLILALHSTKNPGIVPMQSQNGVLICT